MSFHKRHIGNDTVHRLFESGGASAVFDWYTRGVDALILEMGLSSRIGDVINDDDWILYGRPRIEEEITKLIQADLGIKDIAK